MEDTSEVISILATVHSWDDKENLLLDPAQALGVPAGQDPEPGCAQGE